MSVVFYPEAVQRLLRSPLGPVGLFVERNAKLVEAQAKINANDVLIGVRSGDLLNGIFSGDVTQGRDGPEAEVGTTAVHGGFAYPTFHDRHGTRGGQHWLFDSLKLLEQFGWIVSRL